MSTGKTQLPPRSPLRESGGREVELLVVVGCRAPHKVVSAEFKLCYRPRHTPHVSLAGEKGQTGIANGQAENKGPTWSLFSKPDLNYAGCHQVLVFEQGPRASTSECHEHKDISKKLASIQAYFAVESGFFFDEILVQSRCRTAYARSSRGRS